jgi:hypothetical protein
MIYWTKLLPTVYKWPRVYNFNSPIVAAEDIGSSAALTFSIKHKYAFSRRILGVVICIYNVEQINEIENIFNFQNKPPLVLPNNASGRKREYKKLTTMGS